MTAPTVLEFMAQGKLQFLMDMSLGSGGTSSIQDHVDWVPLVDFAVKRGVSLSTLRRYIKQGKVVFRIENGRYLLRDDGTFPKVKVHPLQSQVIKLESELQKAQEEIAELKTLIAFYEETAAQRSTR